MSRALLGRIVQHISRPRAGRQQSALPVRPVAADVRVPVDRLALANAIKRKQKPDFPPSVVRAMEAAGVSQVAVNCEATVGTQGRITDLACESTGYARLDEKVRTFFIGMPVLPETLNGKPVVSKVQALEFLFEFLFGFFVLLQAIFWQGWSDSIRNQAWC